MTSAKKAGSYELKSFKVFKLNEPDNFIDLKAVIANWELTESMNTGHFFGSAYVLDSVSILDNFIGDGWIKGEEEVEIVYLDFFEQEVTHRCFLYSITEVKKELASNETTLSYNLHFISIDKFFTERTMLRRSFSGGTIDTYAQTVFDDYYAEENPDAEIEIEPTTGNQTLVVPNYSPEQTMHFFARKAYHEDSPSATFRFFRNREKYHFKTHEELVAFPITDETILYVQHNHQSQTPDGQLYLMQNIIDIDFPQHVNTINDMVEGAYYRSTTELDILNKIPSVTQYQYLDDYQSYIGAHDGPGGSNVSGVPNKVRSKHSKAFVDEHFNYYRDTLVIKDYPYQASETEDLGVRPHPYYSDIYADKRTNFYHFTNEMVTMRVYGRNDVMAGSVVAIDILKTNADTANRKTDITRSGTYLVETIRNIFDQDSFYQVITMSKAGFSGEQEPAVDYNREPQVINTSTEASDAASGAGGSTLNDSEIVDSTSSVDGGVSGTITEVPTSTGAEVSRVITQRGFDDDGNAYVDVELADGSVVRRTGSRNWRNNNPGNLEYGQFAQSLGAIGTDGRFAIFPSYEAGRKAKEELLFNTSSYRNLTLREAINRYAPPNENDTINYVSAVTAQTGVSANAKMSQIPLETRSRLLDAFEQVEGFKEGTTTLIRGNV